MGKICGGCTRNFKTDSSRLPLPSFASSYDNLKDMLYGEIPDFDMVMSAVRELEKEINAL